MYPSFGNVWIPPLENVTWNSPSYSSAVSVLAATQAYRTRPDPAVTMAAVASFTLTAPAGLTRMENLMVAPVTFTGAPKASFRNTSRGGTVSSFLM